MLSPGSFVLEGENTTNAFTVRFLAKLQVAI